MSISNTKNDKTIILFLKIDDWIWISDQATRNRTTKKNYSKKLIKEYVSSKKIFDHSKWKLDEINELKSIPVELDLEDWIWISNQAVRSKIHKKEFFTNLISEIINNIKTNSLESSVKIVA